MSPHGHNGTSVMMEQARAMALRGWRVLPVAGKKPILEKWPDLATTDEPTIKEWWTQHPAANIGIATGKLSDLFVLDVDPANGGDDTLRALEAQYGALPQTIEALTGGGGRHYYFIHPPRPVGNSAGKLGPGLDIKTEGGQVVAPPSIHPKTGRAYEWEAAHHPDDTPLAEVPTWLLQQLTAPPGPSAPFRSPERIHGGMRQQTLYKLGRSLKARGLCREAIHDALHAENRAKCDPPLTEAEVEDTATHTWTQPDRPVFLQNGHAAACQDDAPASHTAEPHVAYDQWPTLDSLALHGVMGELVRLIEPHTEADPVALLIQGLVAFGNTLNRGPHFRAEADQHAMNLFAVLAGETSKGRKGTSWGYIRRVFPAVDEAWVSTRVLSGLSSGEGLIWAVRDPITKTEPVKEKGRPTGHYQTIMTDPGVEDKRLFVYESEFAAALHVSSRDGNTLTAIIRQAWDAGDLRTMTKNNSTTATGAHTILGHITKDELLRLLDTTEAANGFCNRFLWLCVRRSKSLPEGGLLQDVDLTPLASRLLRAVQFARGTGEIRRDEDARALWAEVYPALSEGRPGLLGAIVSRSEAQVMRLACLYALLDQSALIRAEHLRAALALWAYCDASARYIFGDRLGDPIADELLCALRQHSLGMTRTEIRDWFGRNRKAHELDRGLGLLKQQRLARFETVETGGRPSERWFLGTTETTKAS